MKEEGKGTYAEPPPSGKKSQRGRGHWGKKQLITKGSVVIRIKHRDFLFPGRQAYHEH